MYRSLLPRAFARHSTCFTSFGIRCSHSAASQQLPRAARYQSRALAKPSQTLSLSTHRQPLALVRPYATIPGAAPGTYQRLDKEAKFAREKLRVDPESVTTTSSTTPIFSSAPAHEDEGDIDMMAGIRHDLVSGVLASIESTTMRDC